MLRKAYAHSCKLPCTRLRESRPAIPVTMLHVKPLRTASGAAPSQARPPPTPHRRASRGEFFCFFHHARGGQIRSPGGTCGPPALRGSCHCPLSRSGGCWDAADQLPWVPGSIFGSGFQTGSNYYGDATSGLTDLSLLPPRPQPFTTFSSSLPALGASPGGAMTPSASASSWFPPETGSGYATPSPRYFHPLSLQRAEPPCTAPRHPSPLTLWPHHRSCDHFLACSCRVHREGELLTFARHSPHPGQRACYCLPRAGSPSPLRRPAAPSSEPTISPRSITPPPS